jgi:hypothetical protein
MEKRSREESRAAHPRARGERRGNRDGDRISTGESSSVANDSTISSNEPPVTRISIIKPPPYIDVARFNWPAVHALECNLQCKDEDDHYSRWRDAYDNDLRDLYAIISQWLNSSKVSPALFTEFVYLNSSRYISNVI